MKFHIAAFLFFFICTGTSYAQEAFTIKQYDIAVKVNQDASLDITETINVRFSKPRHGIFRLVPYRYPIQSLPPGMEKAKRQMEWNGYANTLVEDIRVEKHDFDINVEGDYKKIIIGSKDKYVDGNQQYVIHYTVKNAINFFKDHSELYLNLIGDRWPVTIDKISFSIQLYNSLPVNPPYFIATGYTQSKANNTVSKWTEKKIFSGNTTRQLNSKEGVTVGMIFPKDFLTETKFSEQVSLKSFTVKKYDIYVKVNKDATLDVTETIHLHFNKSEEIFYRIFKPQRFRYPFKALLWSEVDEVMTPQIPRPHPPAITNIVVDNQDFSVRDVSGFLKTIDIKSKAGGFTGDQQFIIKYWIIDAIDFFEDHSELYFSFIDDTVNAIDTVSFSVDLYKALPDQPISFVRTGINSFRQNNLSGKWANNKNFSGTTTARFEPGQELTAGINFPKDFITQPNYNLRGIEWLIAPGVIFIIMFIIWMIWGKDDKVTIQTEFYPPDSISPSVAGYLIDNRLNRRDLTALIPYWGANGYLKVTEEDRDVLGVYKKKKYFLKKLKELPANVMAFEKTLFNGIFSWKNPVELSDLKNSLYTTMDTAKGQLEAEIDSQAYYVKNSRKIGKTIILAIAVLIVYAGGFIIIGLTSEGTIWQAAALIFSLIILVSFALVMPKKTKKGNEVYRKLVGFREFIKLVEKDKLEELLKQDENYFDKVLPYAIVFGIADKWKDKLEGLHIRPPEWYKGDHTTFIASSFLRNIDRSMNEMSRSFYSSPPSSRSSSSSGSSGGSWSSSGRSSGSSGGGFGGGGGGSW